MNASERLRTRLMVAAQKFAAEIADAVLEATGEREVEEERRAPRRRRAPERAPAVVGDVDPSAALKAAEALAKLGIRRTG